MRHAAFEASLKPVAHGEFDVLTIRVHGSHDGRQALQPPDEIVRWLYGIVKRAKFKMRMCIDQSVHQDCISTVDDVQVVGRQGISHGDDVVRRDPNKSILDGAKVCVEYILGAENHADKIPRARLRNCFPVNVAAVVVGY